MVHRVMTNALAALGVIALVASGQFDRWVSGIILVGLALALLVRESWQRHPALRHVDSAALLLVATVQVGRFVFGASLLDVLIEFAAALQIIRLATRKGAAHDQQVIVLALLHLIAGTVLGGGLAYGLCFVGVLVVAPGALVLSHLRREVEGNYRQGARDRTGLPVDVPRILRSRRVVGKTFLGVTCLLSIPIFVFTAALFVIFPRVGLSLLLLNRGQSGRIIGFSGKVDLGEVGLLRSDPTIAMRVELPEMADPPARRVTLHLRGTALDHYDGRSWTQSDPNQQPTIGYNGVVPVERSAEPKTDRVMTVELEPIDPPVLFVPPTASGVRIARRGQPRDGVGLVLMGAEGELRYQPVDERGVKYEIFLDENDTPSFQRLPESDRNRYLQMPQLPDRVLKLADEWTAGITDPREIADTIESRLRTDYRYDLASPSGRDDEPLDHFLFESKRGHCEYYSTAMAVLLRERGVPSRNVTGFAGGTYNRFGNFYVVRQGDAHSWVEAYIDGEGWITFDPTPPASALPLSSDGFWSQLRELIEATSQRWDRHVVGYDLQQQVSLLTSVTSKYRTGVRSFPSLPKRQLLLGAGVLLFGGAIAATLWRRRRRQRRREAKGAGRSRRSRLATSLYESLETTMGAIGVPRSPGTPPLRHAKTLATLTHPLADEILALTKVYIDVRFGGAELNDEERQAFEQRVRGLRQAHKKLEAAKAASK